MVETRNTPVQKRAGVPCEMQNISGPAYGDRAVACVRDERVYLTTECLECRSSSSWDLTGVVAEMTERQLLEAQTRAGLAKEPLLRTPDAWRAAIAKAASTAPRR